MASSHCTAIPFKQPFLEKEKRAGFSSRKIKVGTLVIRLEIVCCNYIAGRRCKVMVKSMNCEVGFELQFRIDS